jgi:hypothetical protein
LVNALNALINSLSISSRITLESPCDLTPSLMLLLLSSILQTPLPIHSDSHSQTQMCKVFLGILGDDILKVDLGGVDPKRLASGEMEECVFVGKVLVEIARELGVGAEKDEHDGVSDVTSHIEDDTFTVEPSEYGTEATTVDTTSLSHGTPNKSHSSHRQSEICTCTFQPPPSPSPPSSRCTCPTPSPKSPSVPLGVRYTGYIKPVPLRPEIEAFESSRSLSDSIRRDSNGESADIDLEALISENRRRGELLWEKTRILEEIATRLDPVLFGDKEV